MRNLIKFIRDNAIALAGLGTGGVSIFQGISNNKNMEDQLNRTRAQLDTATRNNFDEAYKLMADKTEIASKKASLTEALQTYNQSKASADQVANPQVKQAMMDNAAKKLDETINEISKSDIGSFFQDLIDQYQNFLLTANIEQKLAVFNIILAAMLLNSFLTVLSILIGEKIISRFKFLDKYPKLIKFIEMRANVNKNLVKTVIVYHLFLILTGLIFHGALLIYTYS
jgi:molecular chaperone GrpE (heat shock protein)